jgi:hypothetical protein
LGVLGVRIDNAAQAARLLSRVPKEVVMATVARTVTVRADAAEIPVGVDGEAIVVSTPVQCTILPAALRVRVPRLRPGRLAQPPLDRNGWRSLAAIAFPWSARDGRSGEP